MVEPVEFERRIQDLVNSAWLLAGLVSAASGREPTTEHMELLNCAERARERKGSAIWPIPGTIDPTVMAERLRLLLGEANDVALGRSPRGTVGQASVAEGRASGKRFSQMLAIFVARSPELRSLWQKETVRVLDVGAGAAGVLAQMLSANPGATGVGLDIDDAALELGHILLAEHGVSARSQLRVENVCDLAEEDAYDFAWVPVHVLRGQDAGRALDRIAKSIKPGGFQVTAVGSASPGDSTDELTRAVARWRLSVRGNCTWDDGEALQTLRHVGLVPTHRLRPTSTEPPVLLAQKPHK